jgi:hypothetical protein
MDGSNSGRWVPKIVNTGTPNAGQLDANSATISSITSIWVHTTGAYSVNYATWLAGIDSIQASNSNRPYLQLSEVGNNSIIGIWTVGAINVSGSVYQFTSLGTQVSNGTINDSTDYTLSWIYPGYNGAQGLQGLQGAQGAAGAQGAVGAQGAAGAQGAVGAQGAAGAQGAQGLRGAQGASSSSATSLTTVSTGSQSSHFITFVDTNNGSAIAESFYTASGISFIPFTGNLKTEGSIAGGYTALATGSTAMGFANDKVVKVTPNATTTYTTTVPPAGSMCTLLILTSGTTSYTITFGSGFKAAGTLATGTVTARVWAISWASDGTNLYQIAAASNNPA